MKENKNRDIMQSFNVAIEGIIETIRTERNMKIHMFCVILIVAVAVILGVTRVEMMFLSISLVMVLGSELLNTAVESVVDLMSPSYNIYAKRAKDVAAGAVFLTSLNALFVVYLIFRKRISKELILLFGNLKSSYADLTLFIVILITVVVIAIKSYFRKGTPLRGGIPSGHSALAGALFMGIFILTDDPKVFYLALVLFMLVLQSRVEGKIHTVMETIIGAILGMGISYIFLTLLV